MTESVIISDVSQVTTAWLNKVLKRSRALINGNLTSITVKKGVGNWSESARIEIKYSSDAEGECPQSLFLKMVVTDLEDEFFGNSEVTYYTRDYIDVKDAPIIRCYDAQFSQSQQIYHLLLDDISETHTEAFKKPITLEYGLRLATALAALHARWWGEINLRGIDAMPHSDEHIRNFVKIAQPGAERIIDYVPNELKPHWPDLMRDLFQKHPHAMIKRKANLDGFTLIHGDVGDANVMVPLDGYDPLYIIDRQPFDWSLTTWLGVYDLAYAIVLDWDIELRRDLEIQVLKRYHLELKRRGITSYSWDQLYDDYRLCAAMGVYIATEYCRGKINHEWQRVWLPYLQRSLTAIDDLNCAELWQNLFWENK